MNTPYGMMIVMISIARPAVAMHAMYSHSIAVRYVVLMSRKGPPVDRRGGPVFSEWKELLRIQYALEQRRVLRAVFVAHGLRRLEERRLVRGDELHALRFELLGRLGRLFIPELA